MKKLLCHYHIYKNSGTSFDLLLTDNFGDSHLCFDGPFPFFVIDQEQLGKIINQKRNCIAFSSHQLRLPAPSSLAWKVLPVVFLRHPLLRVQSMYRFEKKQKDGTNTSRRAGSRNFEAWLAEGFLDNNLLLQISNQQTQLLSGQYRQSPNIKIKDGAVLCDLGQAKRNIQSVELLARTEHYHEDVSRFSTILKKHDIEFVYKDSPPSNTTGDLYKAPLEDRLALLREELSAEIMEKFVRANNQDFELYEYASRLIDKSLP